MDGMNLLRLEHIRIVSMADGLATLARQSSPGDRLDLFRLRRALSKALLVHLAREDWVFYPRLLASTRPEVHALARRLAVEAAAFSSAFQAYGRKWTTIIIEADWLGFRNETLAILVQLKHRIRVEDHELYPLADVADHDPGPRPAGLRPQRVVSRHCNSTAHAIAVNREGSGGASDRA